MSLKSIVTGVVTKPPRVLLMGVPGVGKSTFAAGAPAPIFIQVEDGADVLGVPRFPLAKTLNDVMGNLHDLATEPHDFQTVVIDSLDPLGALIDQVVIFEHSEKERGYGKDVGFAMEKWREILNALTWLRDNKNMAVILIAHTAVKRFDNPETEPYDRWVPRLNERIANLISAWSDAHLFANYKIFTSKTEVGFNKEITRGVSSGDPMLFTREKPAYLAKNRYGLPAEIPMPRVGGWDAFVKAFPVQQ